MAPPFCASVTLAARWPFTDFWDALIVERDHDR
jgi:hypothetical protein